MKVEFLHHYRKRHGLRAEGPADRLPAALRAAAPRASRLSRTRCRARCEGPARLRARSARCRSGAATRSADPRPRDRAGLEGAGCSGEVVLFIDTFNRYFEPENARAALAVLRRGGLHGAPAAPRTAARPLCCGRTFLAAGLVDEAKAEARRMIETLKPYVERGVPIVGLEPSCLLGLRDEFLSMLPGAESGRARAERVPVRGIPRARADGGPPQAQAASRCRRRRRCCTAIATRRRSPRCPRCERVLKLVPGLEVETIESSCCGMAGSFGYDAEHYDVSMKMAELSLLPKVRDAARRRR